MRRRKYVYSFMGQVLWSPWWTLCWVLERDTGTRRRPWSLGAFYWAGGMCGHSANSHTPTCVSTEVGTLGEFDLLFSLGGRRQGHFLRKGDGIEQGAWKEGWGSGTGVVGKRKQADQEPTNKSRGLSSSWLASLHIRVPALEFKLDGVPHIGFWKANPFPFRIC